MISETPTPFCRETRYDARAPYVVSFILLAAIVWSFVSVLANERGEHGSEMLALSAAGISLAASMLWTFVAIARGKRRA